MTGITGTFELTVDQVIEIQIALEHYIEYLEKLFSDERHYSQIKRYKATLEYISKNPYDKEGSKTP